MRVKRQPAVYTALCSVAFLLLLFSTPAAAVELSEKEKAYLQANEEIVFVSQTLYPPFEFVSNEGDHKGMCIDLARWMSTEFGFKAVFTDTNFRQAQEDILSGRADVLTSFFYSVKRDEKFEFTKHIFEVPASIFVKQERTDISGLGDLEGATIAMQSGDYAKEFLDKHGISFQVVYTTNFAEATDLVIAGTADAIVGDEQIVLYHAYENRLIDRIKKVGEPLYVGLNCMATSESNPILTSILNKGIILAEEQGVLEKIHRKWFGVRYTLQGSRLDAYLPYLSASAGLILLLALLIWVWNLRLRRAVRIRTEALRESEERLRAIFRSNPNPLVVYDKDGHVLNVNPAFTEIFGWSLEELKGKRIPYVPDSQRESTEKKIAELFETRIPVTMETKRLTKDGVILDMILSAALITAPDGNISGLVVNLANITERKALEMQFQQAQRMEAIGTLAGGIAHDFNNLLMGIKSRAELALNKVDPENPVRRHLTGIDECVKSAEDLTRQILGFARGGMYDVKPYNPNEILKNTTEMFGRTRKEINIHETYEENVYSVECDQSQLEQAFLNILVNAWQAMPEGGHIYIRTENVILDGTGTGVPGERAGHYVKISMTDTGTGMDRATLDKIFEPFFTTKEKTRGTGLGLASVYGIIQNHNGMINVYSEKGHGTTFTIYLPASGEKPAERAESDIKMLEGDETILIVDDEEMIIEVIDPLLSDLGYTVFTAQSGEQALEIYRTNMDDIDIVILDMIMPDMGGGETFNRLKHINPHVKVLLSSGYSLTDQVQEILDRGCMGFLHKPFNIGLLSQKLREILDAEESP